MRKHLTSILYHRHMSMTVNPYSCFSAECPDWPSAGLCCLLQTPAGGAGRQGEISLAPDIMVHFLGENANSRGRLDTMPLVFGRNNKNRPSGRLDLFPFVFLLFMQTQWSPHKRSLMKKLSTVPSLWFWQALSSNCKLWFHYIRTCHIDSWLKENCLMLFIWLANNN